MVDIKELKKLPPEERIKKIKEMEKERKKEDSEVTKLLKQSEVEAEENIKKQIDQSFEEHAQSTIQQEITEDLETTVGSENIGPSDDLHVEYNEHLQHLKQEEDRAQAQYAADLAQQNQEQVSNEWYQLNQAVEEQGGWDYATQDQREQAGVIRQAEEQKYQAIKDKSYTASEQVISSIKTVLDDITGKYDRGGAP